VAANNRIMPLDIVIAAHLTLFLSQYAEFERKLESYATAIEQFQEGETPDRDREYLMADTRSAIDRFYSASEYGECAEHLINKFVLGRTPFFTRIWNKLFPDPETKRCREMLKENGS